MLNDYAVISLSRSACRTRLRCSRRPWRSTQQVCEQPVTFSRLGVAVDGILVGAAIACVEGLTLLFAIPRSLEVRSGSYIPLEDLDGSLR